MKNKLTLVLFTFMISLCSAQQDFTLYNMNTIGESIEINPSLMPANRSYIGIPAISSNYTLYSNNSFTYRDFHHVRPDDSVEIDVSNALSKLDKSNFLTAQTRVNLLGFGFHVDKNYFSGNITERVIFSFAFPKEFMELINEGNGPYIGQTLDFSKVGFDGTHFREYSLGWAREISKKISLGVRLKYLYGMENFSSSVGDLNITTNSTDYALEMNTNITVNSSTPANNDNSYDQFDDRGWDTYIAGLNNRGFGADLGATFKLNDKWTFNTSILDLGYINWKNDVKNYITDAGRYFFDGVDITSFLNDSTENIGAVLDSLGDAYTPKETNNSYKSYLPVQTYLTSTYNISEKSFASCLLHATFFKKTIQPTVTLGYNHKISNHVSFGVNYSYINHHFDNIGMGVSASAGPVQFYATTDNIIGAIDPLSSHNAHVHFGVNLIFGRPINDRDKDKVADKIDRCPEILGPVELQGCPDRDMDSIPDIDDKCPDVKGPAKYFGCPDSDNDGIIDSEDKCPQDSGLFAFNGCPDFDGDSIPDPEDSCATEKGPIEFHGCPDTDGDLIINKLDSCPFLKGPASNNGCPVIEKAVVKPNIPTKEELEIVFKVFNSLEFETGKSVIRETSYSSLNELISLLQKKPLYKLLIEGHTDNVGNAASNLKLSINRAEAVKKYITEKGVDGTRITTQGYGMTRPVVSNKTPEGRQKNRRVEFTLQ